MMLEKDQLNMQKKCQKMSDRQLARIVLNEANKSPMKVMAARKELRNRGYETLDDIKNI